MNKRHLKTEIADTRRVLALDVAAGNADGAAAMEARLVRLTAELAEIETAEAMANYRATLAQFEAGTANLPALYTAAHKAGISTDAAEKDVLAINQRRGAAHKAAPRRTRTVFDAPMPVRIGNFATVGRAL